MRLDDLNKISHEYIFSYTLATIRGCSFGSGNFESSVSCMFIIRFCVYFDFYKFVNSFEVGSKSARL